MPIKFDHHAQRAVKAIAEYYELVFEMQKHSAVMYSGFMSDIERQDPELRITGWKNAILRPEDDWADSFDDEPYVTITFKSLP